MVYLITGENFSIEDLTKENILPWKLPLSIKYLTVEGKNTIKILFSLRCIAMESDLPWGKIDFP